MPRTRLLDRLDRPAALTAIVGLPGTGKTALVDEWARRRAAAGATVTWLDDDLLGGLVAAAGARPGMAGEAVLVVDRGNDLGNDLVDGLVEPDAVAAALARVPQVRLVVCARRPLPLVAAAYRAGLAVTQLTGPELLATPDELAAAWGGRGLAAVHDHTRGWLLPARLMIDAPTAEDGRRAAAEYVRAVALDGLSDVLRAAALRLALADPITSVHLRAAGVSDDLADELRAVAGDGCQSAAVELRPTQPGGAGLRAAAAPAATDPRAAAAEPRGAAADDGGWSMPPVLRDALRAELVATEPEQPAAWHRRYARALLDAGAAGPAVRHARAAEDWPLLAQAWNAAGLSLLTERDDDLAAGFAGLPASVLRGRPDLRLPAAAARILTSYPPGVRTLQALVSAFRADGEQVLRAEEATPGRPSDRQLQLLSIAIVADRMDGRYERAVAGAARLDRELTGRDGDVWPMHRAWALHQSAQALLLSGNGPRAVGAGTQAYAAAHDRAAHPVTAHIAADLALLHAATGATVDARYWLDVYERHAAPARWLEYLVRLPAHLAAAFVAADRLDGETAGAHLERAEDDTGQAELWPFIVAARTQYALSFGDPLLALADADRYAARNPQQPGGLAARIVDRCRAELLLALGELNRVDTLLRAAGPEAAWTRVPLARFHLLRGEPAQAEHVAESAAWEPDTTPRDRIDLLLIKAAAAEALDAGETADRSFARAAALADRAGVLRPYTLLPAEVRDVLARRSGVALDPAVLAARPAYPARAELVTLTERQQAVLQALTRHEDAESISYALVMAPSLVEEQLRSLYAALGASGRDAALLRARRLGLLPR
ncbi:LuxR family transcriptional regulator, maltose regulon positive regulatory protein [Jiangella alkaliphila]|uniref:LuxR family transcriptional regulator, maltose regulon positive regulatory protein n=1 Tax=Jiangella alkaliphila TaxID=419479 RepID=A0A1H2JHA5_9ACTN|nr:LuxR family transcriptional regulator, maltose regulon positive regulatory protein [Jiangella alkaliphila]